MTLTRKLTASAAAIIATLGLAALAPAEAEAAGCPANGDQIKPSVSIYSPTTGQYIASIDIYYSKTNGGTNTACLNYRHPFTGKRLWSFVGIVRCSSKSSCKTVDQYAHKTDSGYYRQYAGPVGVTGTRDRCVAVSGLIQDPFNISKIAKVTAIRIGCNAEPRTYPGYSMWHR